MLVQPGRYAGLGNANVRLFGKAVTVRSVDSIYGRGPAATVLDCLGTAAHGFLLDSGEGERRNGPHLPPRNANETPALPGARSALLCQARRGVAAF